MTPPCNEFRLGPRHYAIAFAGVFLGTCRICDRRTQVRTYYDTDNYTTADFCARCIWEQGEGDE